MTPTLEQQLALAPWMRIARNELGVREEEGDANNERVVEYLHACRGPRSMLQADSTSWCAAFIAFCLHRAHVRSTDSLGARSYLRYGDEIPVDQARYGDILVFWRGLPLPRSIIRAPGHVAFFDRWLGPTLVTAHNGNQGNQINVLPRKRAQLLRICRPSAEDLALTDLESRGAGA